MDNNILFIEPFYGGSHKVLIDFLQKALSEKFSSEDIHVTTMKAKKWHWRARTSALYFADAIPNHIHFRFLFASSVLNLTELLSLRPELISSKKIVYFHENQLVYPVQVYKERDFQYGYNQILTCLVADVVLFNSNYNRDSFLDGIKKFFNILPDYRPTNVKEKIMRKCEVLYFPVEVPCKSIRSYSEGPLHIVWPHRWEHDKNPGEFLHIVYRLKEEGYVFQISMLGEEFTEVDEDFDSAREILGSFVLHWGKVPKNEYYQILQSSHVVVSTALHEFFGVAMLEATMSGCLPLCPNNLVYPEIYPKECLYNTSNDLLMRLEEFCNSPELTMEIRRNLSLDFNRFSEETLTPRFQELFV